jgi:hypothetical protein
MAPGPRPIDLPYQLLQWLKLKNISNLFITSLEMSVEVVIADLEME